MNGITKIWSSFGMRFSCISHLYLWIFVLSTLMGYVPTDSICEHLHPSNPSTYSTKHFEQNLFCDFWNFVLKFFDSPKKMNFKFKNLTAIFWVRCQFFPEFQNLFFGHRPQAHFLNFKIPDLLLRTPVNAPELSKYSETRLLQWWAVLQLK